MTGTNGSSMKALLVIALSAIALPASAQSLGGFTLGQSEAQVRQTDNRPAVPVSGKPRQSMMLASNDVWITFCSGIVISLEHRVGTTWHDYAAEVRATELQRGPAQFDTMNNRTAQGEMSWQHPRWDAGGYEYRVTIIQTAGGPLSVSEHFLTGDQCEGTG